ncbi:MAG: site-2 protease family protein [Acidimicrobiales bacterium]|nr:site-2 protease family protein [Acidimicrobiales bacterium]
MVKAPRVRLFGIPVRFEPAFFVIVLLLGLPQSPEFVVSWVVIATVSVLVHELGHAVAFRAYGLDADVVLHGFGGLTTAEGTLPPSGRIVTSLAGPLSALVLFGLPALLLEQSGSAPEGAAATIVTQVVWINVGWSLLNLLPVLPLDGGHVFLAICDGLTRGRGRRAAEILSVAVAGALAVWALWAGWVLAAVMAGGLAALNLFQLRKVRQDELADVLDRAHRSLLAGHLDDADAGLALVAADRPTGPNRARLDELRRWSAVFHHGVAGSTPAPPGLSPAAPAASGSTAVRAAETLAAGRRDEGVAMAAWAFANDDAPLAKSLLAAVLAQQGVAGAVATELVLMGDEGRAGARLLCELLRHLGRDGAAAQVAAAMG